jgi:hypothetical protein
MIALTFFTILISIALTNAEFSSYFNPNPGKYSFSNQGGVNGGVNYRDPSGGGFNVGGISDSHGHLQGVSAGFQIPTGENSHLNVGGHRMRGGYMAGGGASWTFKF